MSTTLKVKCGFCGATNEVSGGDFTLASRVEGACWSCNKQVLWVRPIDYSIAEMPVIRDNVIRNFIRPSLDGLGFVFTSDYKPGGAMEKLSSEQAAEDIFNRLCPGGKWWKLADDVKDRYRAEVSATNRPSAAPVVERQPVAYVLTRDEEVCYEADDGIVISNTPGDETNLYKWKPVYFDTSPPAPVAADIAHDRAYRNGMMAGFQFGISGNEKGYALAIANFNSEIHAAKGEPPAPVAVVLPTILSSEQGPHYSDNRTSELGYLAGYNACLDKVKELNQ